MREIAEKMGKISDFLSALPIKTDGVILHRLSKIIRFLLRVCV